ncbi:MAG: hypothetical protein FWF73_06135 [Spirochaetes bacterium]|nr:hypothetical protein [Spirochaetota bacterium]
MAIFIPIIIPCKVYAVDISVGAITWYVWQERAYTEGEADILKFSIDPTFFYGPVVSVKFNDDFDLTFVYLYGKSDEKKGIDAIIDDPINGPYLFHVPLRFKYKRQDADITLSYSLNDYFKIFAGIKYIGYSMIIIPISEAPDKLLEDPTKHNGFGPGLGLSATVPIIGNLFLIGNVSGIYLWGRVKGPAYYSYYDAGYVEVIKNEDAKYKERGVNSALQLAYYIAPASIIITLGGRFQYIVTEYYDRTANMAICAHNETKFYGITLTATYNFNI